MITRLYCYKNNLYHPFD